MLRKDIFRKHSDSSMPQFLYLVFAAYFTDDCADHLRKDLLFTRLVDKDSLVSQPTLSRFWNRMDESTILYPFSGVEIMPFYRIGTIVNSNKNGAFLIVSMKE